MKIYSWYRARDHKNMPNSFNCIYLLEEPKKNAIVLFYHLMIRDNKIIQIMNGQTHIHDDMEEIWLPLENKELIEKANKWINLIEAKNMLLEVSKRFIISIENNRLKKIWE